MEITREQKISYADHRIIELDLMLKTNEMLRKKENDITLRFLGERYRIALECFKDLKKFYEQEWQAIEFLRKHKKFKKKSSEKDFRVGEKDG